MATINISNCKVLMTKTGLAVMAWPGDLYFQPFYCSNDGEFRRYMSDKEAANIVERNLPHIKFDQNIEVEPPEKWKFLWSWKVSDYTSCIPETCNNGGDYAFHETHNIFGRMNSGKLELLDVIRHTTSAEFSYDEANGGFQNSQMGEARFIDCEDSDFMLYTQLGHNEGSQEFSLNQFGQPVGLYTAMESTSYEVWPVEDTDLVEEVAVASSQEREERLQILKNTFNREPPKRR